ncbi:SRPBCC family protein [Bradyrhizobium manausense]|uniref:SRPBCC family protein n=1 Tax=Bradyrhizobium manausense TaxID=989370 RepID=UPI001BA9FE75|nr:SRPBCC family protein [Bradyrhizobium manausense]MBR0687841.1 SRPBCC family protein [Bradyrhizobium manausense]
MRKKMVALSALMLLTGVATANAVEVKEQIVVSASPEVVWKVANEYCSIKTWGKVFSNCTQNMKDGVVWRFLTVKDGGGIVKEKLTDVSDTSYSYSIIEAPLPIEHHTGKIWVEPGSDASHTVVKWHVSFDVKAGNDKAKTTQAINEILVAGLGGIKEIAEKTR